MVNTDEFYSWFTQINFKTLRKMLLVRLFIPI